MKCGICNSSNTSIRLHKHLFTVKNKSIEIESERRFCNECGNLVYDSDLDNIASKNAIKKYNVNFGIDTERLISLRKTYGLSQLLFSKIIGCAKKTLVSYEQGNSIPNDNFMIVLKTLIACPHLITNFIDANKERFNEKEYEKIQNRLTTYIGANSRQIFDVCACKPTIFNGYTIVSLDKIKNLILFLTSETISKTKLLKEMFYTDFIFYRENAASITGLEYCKFPYGPVPDDFEHLLQYLYQNNIISYEYIYDNNIEHYDIKALIKPDLSAFSDEEITIIHKIKDYFKLITTQKIVEYSHNEKAFIKTENKKNISYEYALDIELLK